MSPQPNQEKMFSCGLELADVVLNSDLLQRSLKAIQKLNDDPTKKNIRASSCAYKAYNDDQNKCEIIAFGCEFERVSSVLSPTTELCPPEFKFLQTRDNTFSINEVAITLFRSLLQDLDLFQRLKNPSRPLIVTGHSLGGWVASLFCLWLLDNIHQSNRNIPICITFGSPLVGDDGLRKAINNRSGWNPRFLHVVSDGDLIPRTFLSSTITTNNNKNSYRPFGTFLMCSSSGSACFDDPDSVLSLLKATGWSQLPSLMDYKKLLDHLTHQIIVSNGPSQLGELRGDPLQAGIILQLDAIGDKRKQMIQEEDTLITAMEKRERMSYHEQKKRISESEKKLNDVKMNMAHLEWYKKISSTKVSLGYYDCYKNKPFERDIKAVLFKARLTKYWEDVVDEAERKPRKPGFAPMGTRLLFGGTNYRRMVEPLDIAEYYKQGKRNYRTQGRPKHYKLLQTWQEEEERAAAHKRKSSTRDKAATLTEDSCFWADVEEAMILTKSLKNGEAVGGPEESPIEQLQEFEDYVMRLIDNLAVTPEIFLKESTFTLWWNEYKNIPQRNRRSLLATFMENERYQKYI
ncbi:senescence-associated carboxylesterase 101-like isoform X2 [Telopea speciosissima]|uniref:senescence-associated carboxylesterase 101-like isoform X2 n=1 Tax=Telopea speciosissima TaxID=54955 RepID=UPI001CC7D077|nr:senescence-associated carboxylesterase 101-like isoform X2 [Telopea speciosissima]